MFVLLRINTRIVFHIDRNRYRESISSGAGNLHCLVGHMLLLLLLLLPYSTLLSDIRFSSESVQESSSLRGNKLGTMSGLVDSKQSRSVALPWELSTEMDFPPILCSTPLTAFATYGFVVVLVFLFGPWNIVVNRFRFYLLRVFVLRTGK